MQMAKSLHPHEDIAAERLRARHRVGVLMVLIKICRQIEHMQTTVPGREACRDVAGLLSGLKIKRVVGGPRRR